VQRGEPHWDVPADAAAEQVALRKAGDAWDGLIGRYCDARKETTVEEVMRDCLEIDKARATNADAARIRSVLRDFGWRNTGPGTVMWHGGKAVRKWVRPGYAEQRLDEIRAPAVQPTTPDPVTDNNPFDPDCPF
jgi:predicted P-loop ATPase